MKLRLGPAWLQRDETCVHPRRGRPKPGYLDEQAAIAAKGRVVRDVELELG